ncbi:TPA: lipoate--protein ligase family protein [Candidatus Geothermarchaeota archaeon]|nr:lipoate--protein ligase family protein [Candidatus Geothermarchaeota archaeon]
MRIIQSFGGDPIYNIALEEVLSDLSIELKDEIIRLWIEDKTLVIGYGQRVEDEIDIEEAYRHGIPIVRRQSGGGTVYHDLGNINISLYLPIRILDVSKIYEIGSRYILSTLRRMSLEPYIENRNDIVVDGYKVSGSSIWIRRKATVYHATLLVDADIDLMMKLLKPPIHLVREGRVKPSKYRPTNLKHFIDIDVGEALKIIRVTVAELAGKTLPIRLDGVLYRRLEEKVEKYLDSKWNINDGYKGSPPYNLLQ